MSKEPSLIPNKEWTKSATARSIMECQKQIIELQMDYFNMLGTLKEGGYKRATETIENLISDVKNHNLILQALLLEFDGNIPIDGDNMRDALNELKNAMEDTDEE